MLKKLKEIVKRLRAIWYFRLCKSGIKAFKSRPTVNARSRFNHNTFLGENTHFNGIRIKGGGRVTIGDNFHSGQELLFLTEFHNYLGKKLPYDETTIVKEINIEDNVWLGDRVTVLGGVTIGEGAIIQAGSVVVSDIPKCAIAGGHPARVFKYRCEEDYEAKKNGRQFF